MESVQTQTEQLTFEKVWMMFQESKKEMDRWMKESKLEADRRMKETDRQLKELGKQIGGLGNKFGTFNEGLFMPSLNKMLEKRFKCKKTTENFYFRDNGNEFEIDLLGVSEEACYIVEFKSHLRDDGIEQTIRHIELFKKYVTEYSDKILFGIIVATHHDAESRKKVLSKGIYFISSAEDIAKLNIPKGFKPRQW